MNLPAGVNVRSEMVAIKDIEINTFVRTGIDQDRVQCLGILVEGGTVLDPILLIPEYELDGKGRISFVPNSKKRHVVDGRHRLKMWDDLLDQKTVKAVTIVGGVETEVELIGLAFQSNTGGALPPTQKDIEHTVENLLERKVPKRDIAALLGMPEVAVKSFINKVEQRLEQAKVCRAVKRVVREDVNVATAAQAEGTTAEKVRAYIARGNRRRKETAIESATKDVKFTFRSLNSTIQVTIRNLVAKYGDGDVMANDVLEVLEDIEGRTDRFVKSLVDLRKRFEDKINGGKNGDGK